MKLYNKDIKRGAQAAAKYMPKKRVKKLYQYSIPSFKKADEMFNGTIDWNKVDYESYKKSALKLEKLNNNLSKKVEKIWKSKGIKKYSFDKRRLLLQKSFERHIPENVINYVEKRGYPFKAFQDNLFKNVDGYSIAYSSGGESSSSNTSSNENKLKSIEEQLKSGKDENGKELTKEQLDRLKSAQLALSAIKKSNYKYNDIHSSHVSLFRIVSSRYMRSLDRLDQKGVDYIKSEKDRTKALNSLYDLVDQLN